MITLPLKSIPETTFEIEIGNIPYQFTLYWNRRAGKLTMSIIEDQGYTINGISVTSGSNFIERFSFTTLKYMYAINVADYSQDLDFYNLGETSSIVILDESEVEELESEQDAQS